MVSDNRICYFSQRRAGRRTFGCERPSQDFHYGKIEGGTEKVKKEGVQVKEGVERETGEFLETEVFH